MAMAEDGGGVYVGEKVSRQGDMGEGLKLEILREADGDLIVSIMKVHDKFSPDHAIQFCVPGTGGGASRHTFKALQDLRVAMALDEQERKQPLPDPSIQVLLADLWNHPTYRGDLIPREAMQEAFLRFSDRLRAKGGVPVELGIPKPDLFEPADVYERRIHAGVDEAMVCGKLNDLSIQGHQVIGKFTPGGPKGDLIKALTYQEDYTFSMRALTEDADGKTAIASVPIWSVVSPKRY